MEHVIRSNQLFIDLFFSTLHESVIPSEERSRRLIDPYYRLLVGQLLIRGDEAAMALGGVACHRPRQAFGHAVPVVPEAPCTRRAFLQLCEQAIACHERARCLLAQQSSEELSQRNRYYHSRLEFATIADVVTYLLVAHPAAQLGRLRDQSPTSMDCRKVLGRRYRWNQPGAFLLSEFYPGETEEEPDYDVVHEFT